MANKVDLNDLEMILSSKELDIPREKQVIILEELNALAERLKDNEPKQKQKNEFMVIPIVEDSNLIETFKEHSYIIVQVPQESDPDEIETLLLDQLNEVSISSMGKKHGLNKVSTAISKVKNKNLILKNGKKMTVKTKVPVQAIPLLNNLN